VDLAPTLLDLAGVEAPAYSQGRSFAGTHEEIRDYVFASKDRIDDFEDRERAVRDHRYKYIRSWTPSLPNGHRSAFRDNMEMVRELWVLHEQGQLDSVQEIWFLPTGKERLYDTKMDPFEIRNLAGDPTHEATLKRMRKAMWPGGHQPVTAAPEFLPVGRRVKVVSDTQGASLRYRIGNGPWKIYTEPISVPEGASLRAQAVRYGYTASQERVAP
jgi:arylsulfatase A-like enzyme